MNLCGATAPRDEHRQGGRLLYIETDPVCEQIRVAEGERALARVPRQPRRLFTYGENLGAADSPVPLERFTGNDAAAGRARPVDGPATSPTRRRFTTIATWENKGKDITFGGETYHWSKHVNFLRFLDLPRLTPAAASSWRWTPPITTA